MTALIIHSDKDLGGSCGKPNMLEITGPTTNSVNATVSPVAAA